MVVGSVKRQCHLAAEFSLQHDAGSGSATPRGGGVHLTVREGIFSTSRRETRLDRKANDEMRARRLASRPHVEP